MDVDLSLCNEGDTNNTLARPRLRRKPLRSTADRELAREAAATVWMTSWTENGGRVIDQVKFLQEQAAMGNGSLAMMLNGQSDSDDEQDSMMMGVVAATRGDYGQGAKRRAALVERICSCCGYLPTHDGSDFVPAAGITNLVAATRFHSIECAKQYYTLGLEQERHHLLPAIYMRIERTFDETRTQRSGMEFDLLRQQPHVIKKGGNRDTIGGQSEFVYSLQQVFDGDAATVSTATAMLASS